MRERRRFPRAAQPFEARYRPFGVPVGGWQTVQAINLSAGGMRFRGPESIAPGARLELVLHLSGSTAIVTVEGTVVWSRMEASGVTEHGVEFAAMPLEQQLELDQLVHHLSRGSAAATPLGQWAP